jgi:K+-sensing histidine kinase KdpD
MLGSLIDTTRGTPPPFDEWRGGLGLALPVGRRVIDAHGGALWSAANARSGSALRLPLRTQERT